MSNQIQQVQQRQIACKAWIGDLLKGNLAFDGERFNFIEVAHKKIFRVNIIANVIDKYKNEDSEKQYSALSLDDASGQIRVKTFGGDTKKLSDVNIGDTILVVGQLRYFNNELYVIPEIIRQLDEKWLIVRKLELDEQYDALSKENIPVDERSPMLLDKTKGLGRAKKTDILVVEEKLENEPEMKAEAKVEEKVEEKEAEGSNGIKESIFNLIKQSDEGVNVDTLIMSVNYPVYDINAAIAALIEDGRIYEPRPGKLRSI